MKRRNVFLFAVIFSAGIASAVAEEPVDENMRRETTYYFGSSALSEGTKLYIPSFVYSSAGNNTEDTTLFDRNGLAGSESERNDYSAGYKNDGASKKRNETAAAADRQEPLLPEEGDSAKDETAASRASDENEMLHVYDFSVPFDDSVTETIGFTGRDVMDDPLVFADVIPVLTDNSLPSDNASFSFLTYQKNVFTNDENAAKILTGDSYDDKGDDENVFAAFSRLLTIPFALLSIAVCGGALLIMFTSSGKKTNV